MLLHFHHYRGHLAFIKKQMAEWKPQELRDYHICYYSDSGSIYFAPLFGENL